MMHAFVATHYVIDAIMGLTNATNFDSPKNLIHGLLSIVM
jgi:hypothetical protein